MNTKEFIDLHVHIGPEPLPRKFTVSTLIKAETGKIKAMALKNHFYPTNPLITPFENSKIGLIGSVTLNSSVGGLNPEAVQAAANISAKPTIVWFPTISARNFLEKSKYQLPPDWARGSGYKPKLAKFAERISIMGNDGKLTKATMNVLKAIAENKCILATGHLSWQESNVLVKAAKAMGIGKIIITHPIYQKIAMPIEIQKKLTGNGVYIEQAFSMYYIDKIPPEELAMQIRAIGPENCIMTSDMGQVTSPNPSSALAGFARLLQGQGIKKSEIEIMAIRNPFKLLG